MLSEYLPEQIFAFMLVVSRIAGMIMLMPVFGEIAVPLWVRLSLTFAVSAVLYPLVKDFLPALPGQPLALAVVVASEAMVGIFIGGGARLLLTALNVAGMVIAMQTGLAAAQGFDPNQQSQSAIISTFMILLGVNLILASGLHYLLIAAMHDSYQVFAPGHLPPVSEFASMTMMLVAKSFALGLQMAAPFIVFGLIFNLGMGMIARLMPQVQIFFIAAPAQIMLGFLIFGVTISSAMLWYLEYFETGMGNFLAPR